MLVSGIFDALGIVSIVPFITVVLSGPSSNSIFAEFLIQRFGFVDGSNVLAFLGFGAFGVYVASMLVKSLMTYYSLKFAFHQQHLLSQKLLESYLSQPFPWFAQRNTSEVGKNILEEINAAVHSGLMPLLNLFASVAVILSILIMLMIIDFLVTISLLVIFGTLYSVMYLASKKFIDGIGRARLAANRRRFGTVAQALALIKIVKLKHLEDFFSDRFTYPSLQFANYNAIASA